MFALIPRTLTLTLQFYSSSPLRLPLFLSAQSHYSSAASSFSHAFRLCSRRHFEEEESRNVKVSVWWDFENCQVPLGVNVYLVANRIVSAIRGSGIKGPVTITAFGDVSQLSRSAQEALTSTGVTLNHVPNCGKNSSDKSFMADLAYWVSQNPPPVHFFLISGDSDFAYILHRLRMSNYNILLSSPDTAQPVLYSAATVMWSWPDLVKGEGNLMVKHFNNPPDGPHGSWYWHYKGALDDPYPDMNHVNNSQMVEPGESISSTNGHAVPKVLIDSVTKFLQACPEGMQLSILRTRLERDNISFGKDFFGYKRFSQLLSSMPDLVKLKFSRNNKSEPVVCLTEKALAKSLVQSNKPVKKIENNDKEKGSIPSTNCESAPVSSLSSNSSLEVSPQLDAIKDCSTDNSVPTVKLEAFDKQKQESVSSKNDNTDVNFSATPLIQDDRGAAKVGLLKRMLRIWVGPRSEHCNGDFDKTSGKDSPVAEGSVSVVDSGLDKTTLRN